MKNSVVFCLGALLFLPLVQSAQAGLPNAVYWDFGPSVPSASATSNSFSGLTVSPFSRGNDQGITGGVLFNATSASTSYTTAAGFANSAGTNAVADTLGGTLNTSSSTYFSTALSLDLSASFFLTITDVSLGSRSTSTGPTTLSLYGSTDGFSSDSELLGSITVTANSVWAADDFSSLSLAINPGETVSLRLYGSGGSGTASSGNWRIDDLAIALSSSPVPEPSSLALVALGGASCLLAFRRKR
jgi:PEP-CTERM motif